MSQDNEFGPKDPGLDKHKNRRDYAANNQAEVWKSKYPHNIVQVDKAGNLFERDSTPNAERIRIRHCSGSGSEWLFDGTHIETSVGHKYVYLKGGETKTVDRGLDHKVHGIERRMNQGQHFETNGNSSHAVRGDHAFAAKNSTTRVSENIDIGGDKSVTLVSGESKAKITLTPDGGCTVECEGNISFASKGKLALNGESVHIAAGSLELGFDNFKMSSIHIPNIGVGYAVNAQTAVDSGPGYPKSAELPTKDATKTDRQAQASIEKDSVREPNKQSTKSAYTRNGPANEYA